MLGRSNFGIVKAHVCAQLEATFAQRLGAFKEELVCEAVREIVMDFLVKARTRANLNMDIPEVTVTLNGDVLRIDFGKKKKGGLTMLTKREFKAEARKIIREDTKRDLDFDAIRKLQTLIDAHSHLEGTPERAIALYTMEFFEMLEEENKKKEE